VAEAARRHHRPLVPREEADDSAEALRLREAGLQLVEGVGHRRRLQRARVAEGTRTPDHRDHNPGLYQLSYRHRERATA
jgi:hypothetical protein